MSEITVTLTNMENHSYDRDTRILYRGNKILKPVNGIYTLKYRKITCTRTVEQIHTMTHIDHRPLTKTSAMIRTGDEEAIAIDRINGMGYKELCEKFHCSESTIARAMRITGC
jgi:hypothetical protein